MEYRMASKVIKEDLLNAGLGCEISNI